MTRVKVHKMELINKKYQKAILSKDIEEMNGCELHWLFNLELGSGIPSDIKEKMCRERKLPDALNDKYLILTQWACGWRSQEKNLRAALFLGKHLNRTVIFNSMMLNDYHNRLFNKKPSIADISTLYDMEKLNSYTKAIDTSELSPSTIKEIICNDSKFYRLKNDNIFSEEVNDCKFASFLAYPQVKKACLSLYPNTFQEEMLRAAEFVSPAKTQVKKAEDIISSLGEYYAIHVRRGDCLSKISLAWKHKGIGPKKVSQLTDLSNNIETLKKWIPFGKKIYIATDEEDLTMFDELKKHYDVYFWKDFNIELSSEENNSYYVLGVEEIIMIRAARFIGTIPSTISLYVDYKRGSMKNIDQKIYNLSPEKYLLFSRKDSKIARMWDFTLRSSIDDIKRRMEHNETKN